SLLSTRTNSRHCRDAPRSRGREQSLAPLPAGPRRCTRKRDREIRIAVSLPGVARVEVEVIRQLPVARDESWYRSRQLAGRRVNDSSPLRWRRDCKADEVARGGLTLATAPGPAGSVWLDQ